MGRIGLALAGGGPVGGIYEAGALAALDEAIEGFDLVDADMFVGVSVGSLICACMANGIPPARIARIMAGHEPEAFDPETLFRPAIREYWRRTLSLPPVILSALREHLRHPFEAGWFDYFERLSKALPIGIFDGEAIEGVLDRLFRVWGVENDFRKCRRKLFIVATDLDSGEAVAFGASGRDKLPITTAVRASCSVPGLFTPVNIDGRMYVDGGLIRTMHASILLKEGADFVFCVNPIVPFDAHLAAHRKPGSEYHLDEGGLPIVLSQTIRAMIHSRMVIGMERYRHQFRNADVLLFEPTRDDAEMFFVNLFSYRGRQRLCEHAYQQTRRDLYWRRHEIKPVLERHGMGLNVDVLKDHTRTLLPDGANRSLLAVTRSLRDSLDELDRWLAAQA